MRALLATLHCPYCGSPLALEKDLSPAGDALTWGIAQCHCYRYPIIDGILVLQQYSPAYNTENKLANYLDAGDRAGALAYALSALSPVPGRRPGLQKALSMLEKRAGPLAGTLRAWQSSRARALAETDPSLHEALVTLRPSIYADYLFYRYANPSFLASLPLLTVFGNLSGGAVLDLASGIGHSSFMISQLFPKLQVIAADHDFLNLYVAKRYIAPNVTPICLNSEAPLPFSDQSLAGVWCMDGLHYVRSKVALGQELQRVTREDGIWIFPHQHNSLRENPSPGIPVTPDDYRRCFAGLSPHVFVETDILRDFTQSQELDLSASPTEDALQAAPVVSIVASREGGIWRRYEALAHTLAGVGHLALNPIYATQEGNSAMQLRMVWPSQALEAECSAVKQAIPVTLSVERGLFDRLRNRRLAGEDMPAVERLIQSCVVLPLPDGYA